MSILLENPIQNSEKEIGAIMGPPFPLVEENLPFSKLSRYFNSTSSAVLAKDTAGQWHILTQFDVIQAI